MMLHFKTFANGGEGTRRRPCFDSFQGSCPGTHCPEAPASRFNSGGSQSTDPPLDASLLIGLRHMRFDFFNLDMFRRQQQNAAINALVSIIWTLPLDE